MTDRLPSTEPDDPASRYLAELQEAVRFSRSLGCTRHRHFRPTSKVATEAFAEIIREWARLNVCSRSDERIAGRCLEITFDLVEFLDSAGVASLYTLGWMSFAGKPAYRFTQENVRTWLAAPAINRTRIDMHAWVTLLSGEIIDPSWLSTVGIVRGQRALIGAVIISEPAQPTSHRYHPITVDTAILPRLGLANPLSHEFLAQQAPPPAAIVASLA